MSGRFRLPSGGRLDRRRAMRFSFDGKSYQGFAGDTLASALLANGVHLVGRSFKYHRPRGIVTAGSDEPNALIGVGGDDAHYTPNLRATQVEIYEREAQVAGNGHCRTESEPSPITSKRGTEPIAQESKQEGDAKW